MEAHGCIRMLAGCISRLHTDAYESIWMHARYQVPGIGYYLHTDLVHAVHTEAWIVHALWMHFEASRNRNQSQLARATCTYDVSAQSSRSDSRSKHIVVFE